MKKFFASICVAGLLLSGCGSEKPVEQPPPKVEQTNKSPADEAKVKETIQAVTPAQSEAPAPPPAPAKVLNLGMTLEQFKAAYNARAQELAPEGEWDITSVNLSHGADSDGFAYQFLPNVGMIGEIEKGTGLIKRISIVSTPQSVNDTLGAIIAYSLVMFTFNPELKHEDNGGIYWTN